MGDEKDDKDYSMDYSMEDSMDESMWDADDSADPTDAPVVCPTDVQECPDGSSVSRDPAKDCAFPACPGSDTTECKNAEALGNNCDMLVAGMGCDTMCVEDGGVLPSPCVEMDWMSCQNEVISACSDLPVGDCDATETCGDDCDGMPTTCAELKEMASGCASSCSQCTVDLFNEQ